MSECVFCQRVTTGPLLVEHPLVVAFADGFPVTEGHTLVVPRRHQASVFELTAAEYGAIWEVVATVRSLLSDSHRPDGFNVGVNAGAAAGQTVLHAHVHVIPRWKGDVDDPRGGVRWVVPGKARYWSDG